MSNALLEVFSSGCLCAMLQRVSSQNKTPPDCPKNQQPVLLRLGSIEYRVRTFVTSSCSQRRKVFRESSVLLVSWLRCGRSRNCGLTSVRGTKVLSLPTMFRPAETQPALCLNVSPVLQWLGFEAEHPSVTIRDMNIAWIYIYTPPYIFMTHCAAFNLQFSFLYKLNKFV